MKTNKQHMNDHFKSMGMVRLVDLKVSEKFYGMDWDDENVYELMSLEIIHGDSNNVKYSTRMVGTKTITETKMNGEGVVNRTTVVRYKGRDRGSFIAGFKAAMRLYQSHMQEFDKENAGLDDMVKSWNTMNQEFGSWKKGY